MKRIFPIICALFLSLTTQAQKIPFQGKLTENDDPVTGTRAFKFSIALDTTTWTETHPNVSVLDGYYSVVLGSITPLPDNIFGTGDETSLSIEVDGTSLGAVTIYRPYQQTVFTDHFDGTNDKAALTVKRTGADGSAFAAMEVISQMTGSSYALYGEATGQGDNTGVYGYASGTGISNWGVFGIGSGEGDGTTGYGTGSYNDGVVGYARDNAWGNTGVWGRAYGAQGVDNIGVVGWSEVNNGSDTIMNTGVLGWAKGPGVNFGIRGMADSGADNWAGWFDGRVKIIGQLEIDGQIIGGGGGAAIFDSLMIKGPVTFQDPFSNSNFNFSPGFGWTLNGPDTEVNVMASHNWLDGGSESNNRGAVFLFADTISRNLDGIDTRRVELKVSDDGFGKGVGRLRLMGPQVGEFGIKGFAEMGVFTNDGANHHGELMLRGSATEEPLASLRAHSNFWGGERGELLLTSSSRSLAGLQPAAVLGANSRDFGSLSLFGDNVFGDQLRAELRVDSIGSLGSGGSLNLLGPLDDGNGFPRTMFSVRIANDPTGSDPGGASAEAFFWGSTTPNIQMGGKQWENNDLPYITMFGNSDNGSGWYHSNVDIDVTDDGTYNSSTIMLSNSKSGGTRNSSVQLFSNYGSGGGGIVLLDSTGTFTIDMMGSSGTINAVTVNQTSDARLKENITRQENALAKVKQLRGVNFEWKDDRSDARHIGFIAQEVEEIYPEVVETKKDGYKAVNYAVLVSALVEAIKELDAKVATLQSENDTLKARLEASLEASNSSDIDELRKEIESIKALLGASATRGASK